MSDPRIRRAQERDVDDIVGLVHEPAAYEAWCPDLRPKSRYAAF